MREAGLGEFVEMLKIVDLFRICTIDLVVECTDAFVLDKNVDSTHLQVGLPA